MTRRLAEGFIGALFAAVVVGATAAPVHGQASQTPPAEAQPVYTLPERPDTAPEQRDEREKPRMQREEETLFACATRDDVERFDG